MGLLGLCLVIPLPQETAGGENFNDKPCTPTRNGGVCAHPLQFKSNGEDEPNGGGAAKLLLSRKFSFSINGRVQEVILACNIALEINLSWLMLDLDSKNTHTFCSRDKLETELELNVAYTTTY
jgi:hypothetical protein